MFKYIDAISYWLFNSLKRHALYFIIVIGAIVLTNAIVNNFVPQAGEEHKWMFLYAVNSLLKVLLEMMLVFVGVIIVTYASLSIYKKVKNKDEEDSDKTSTPTSSQD